MSSPPEPSIEPEDSTMADSWQKTRTPGVYKRGGSYVYSYRVRGKQKWGSAKTYAEARRLKGKTTTGEDTAEQRDNTRVPFGTHALRWVDNYQGRTDRGFKEKTRRGYRQALEAYAIPYFDRERGMRLGEIEPRDIKDFIAWMAKQPNPKKDGKPLSKTTIKRKLAPVCALFADAVEDGLLRSNPTFKVRVLVPEANRTQVKKARALTRAQLGRFLEAVQDDQWRLFFELLAHTGLRISEATELRWGRDIQFGAKPHVKVRWQWDGDTVCPPKSEAGLRDIPLSPAMAKRLWRRQGTDGEPVFPGPTGRRVDISNLRKTVLDPAAKTAGVEWAGFHSFRHTCASFLFGAGTKNIKQVQEWLGHADPGFTLRTYVHLIDEGMGDASFLDGLIVVGDVTDEADAGALDYQRDDDDAADAPVDEDDLVAEAL